MKLGSLFDGIGGFPLAGVRNGFTPVWAAEIERVPIEITKKHFPDMKHLGDVTQINGAEIEPVDVITFGSPCQDLSTIGKKAGLDGERSGLFLHAIRIIQQMRDATDGLYPRFAIWENVPGAFSSNDRQDFRRVLAELAEAEVPMPRSGKWANSGMVRVQDRSIAWRTYDSQYWGVPQRRKRIYLVTDFGGQCGPEILFKSDSLRGDFEARGAAREEVAGDVGNSASSKFVDTYNLSISETHHTLRSAATGTDFACVVNSNTTQNGTRAMDNSGLVSDAHYQVRRLTPLECERLQGFPDNWTAGHRDSARYKAIGNSVTVAIPECILGNVAEAIERSS